MSDYARPITPEKLLCASSSSVLLAPQSSYCSPRSRETGFFRWPLRGAPGRTAERLVVDYTPANGANGGIAPVHDGFYYVALADDATPRAVRFYEYASGATHDVAPVPPSTSIGVTVSPDGTQLLYATATAPETDIVLLAFLRQD